MDKKVFDGIHIVDFGWAIAGPLSIKYFADYGATVVCIESLQRPDLLRISSPFKDGRPNINRAGFFSYFAANKYSVSLDLTRAAARETGGPGGYRCRQPQARGTGEMGA